MHLLIRVTPVLLLALGLAACDVRSSATSLKATGYNESRGLGLISGYSSKKVSNDRWQVNFDGNQLTSVERAKSIAQLRAAQIAEENGFSHFEFKSQDLVRCDRTPTLTTAMPVIKGVATYSNQPQDGYLDARDYLAANMPLVQGDATTAEKQSAFDHMLQQCRSGVAVATF